MIDRINTIIDELTNSQFELTNTLLKVQVLAHKLKNEKLKEWVDSEINGYKDEKCLPTYRILPTAVYGNLEQDRGYGGLFVRENVQLSVAWISNSHKVDLLKITLLNSVSALEQMLQQEHRPRINLTLSLCNIISTKLSNGYRVSSAWQIIQHHTIKEVLNSIKSNLLQFMLDIGDELGEGEKIDIVKKKNVINDLFDKNLGSGNTFNINTGAGAAQTNISGKVSGSNVAIGDNNQQTTEAVEIEKLKDFIFALKQELEKNPSIDNDDLKDLQMQIGNIETQLDKKKPRYSILKNSMTMIKSIISETSAIILSSKIIEHLDTLPIMLG